MKSSAKCARSICEAFRGQLAVYSAERIWEWAEQHVELPSVYAVPGRFASDHAPYTREVFDALQDPAARDVIVRASVQSLKTLIGEIWLLWSIIHDPGPTQWLQVTDQEAREHAEERFNKLLESCAPVMERLSSNPYDRRRTSILFSNMFLRMEGAETLSNLQRKSIKNQMCSEVWQWPAGHLSEAGARLTQFGIRSKRYIESQGGLEGDDLDVIWRRGDQAQWEVACPSCGKYQPLQWSVFRGDGSRAGLRWSETDPLNTVRYECLHCGGVIVDEPRTRHTLNLTGRFAGRAAAQPRVRSFAWNQLSVESIRWRDLVAAWLEAREQIKRGNELPQREFVQKRLGEHYEPRHYQSFKPLETINLTSSSKWPEEMLRLLTVDVQADHFWALLQGFSRAGDSLAYWFGRCYTWAEIEELQKKWAVPPRCVLVDCGYRQAEVYAVCAAHGVLVERDWHSWMALKGMDKDEFVCRINKRVVRLPYTWPPAVGDPSIGLSEAELRERKVIGKYCPVIYWSNPVYKDLAARRRDGLAPGVRVITALDISQDFQAQMYAERKVRVWDKYNRETWRWERVGRRPNHAWDCYCMSLVGASIARVLRFGAEKEIDSPPAGA